MTSRTRTAKTAAPAPAKKATAKQRPTRTRTPRKTAASPTAPALSLVKPTPTSAAGDRRTVVDLRYPLTMRRRLFVGPMGPHEQAAIRAALASAALRLPVPVRTWNGSQAQLADGTLLIHNPGPDRTFTAHIACTHGAVHGWPIRTANDLGAARAITRTCATPHTGPTEHEGTEYDWDKAIAHGARPVLRPKTKPPAVHFLREGVRRAAALHDETEPLNLNDIADGLAERPANSETAKEHPQP